MNTKIKNIGKKRVGLGLAPWSALFFAVFFIFVHTPYAHAQTSSDLSLTPAVIDEKVKARDIVKETIMVKNNTSHVLELYPSVNDINKQEGEQGFQRANDSIALSDSLANWIEISRGMVQLGPGEEKAIPFIIRINGNAVSNAYHAQISLTEGVTRAEADAKPALGVVMVNVEVQADVKELLELKKFATGSIFFSGDDIMFNYELQNIGNQNLEPTGHVFIYNRNGTEVASIDVNRDSKTISPEQVSDLASVWSAANGFGRYKAMLSVDYGSSQTASVQDTVFFWVIPWKQMLIMFTISLAIIIMLVLYFHRWLERRHLYKFAHAGLLNEDTLQKIKSEDMETEPAQHVPPPIVRQSITALPAAPRWKPASVAPVAEVKSATVKAEHKSLKEVLQKEVRPTTHGSSINLKQMRAHAQAAEAHSHHASPAPQANKPHLQGHVISLKKKND